MKDMYKIENKYNRSFIGLMEQSNTGEWCKTDEASGKLYVAKLRNYHLQDDVDTLTGRIENYIRLTSILLFTSGVSILLLIIALIKIYTDI